MSRSQDARGEANLTAPQDYDEIALEFGEYAAGAVTEWSLGYPNVARHLETAGARLILDCGCGAGNFSSFLSHNGFSVTGVDISAEMIRAAATRDSSISFVHRRKDQSVRDLVRTTFDAVVLNFVLCTIPAPASIVALLSELHEVVRPGGTCLALHTNWERCNGKEFASFRLDRVESLESGMAIGLTLKSDPPVRIDDYFWSRDDYCTFFQEAGFAPVSVEEIRAGQANHAAWIDEAGTSPFYIIAGRKPDGKKGSRPGENP